ncbi:hypothetical protein DL93DRAFT_2172227 [Clavulina sp. PMI_390]|nr:hypothetical protein DL93DRAFT_2172227 [Clavulina sp. PMI_390]
MEQLLGHCVKELSFEGDLGCSITQWPEIVQSFYAIDPTTEPQLLDDDYLCYLWNVFIQSPNVRIGLKPHGARDVWIAPKAGKGSSKNDSAKRDELEPLEDGENTRSWTELVEIYGEDLHVATTREIIFQSLTGSHVQPSKLSDMAYTALQIISRARERGLPVDDITKLTGYSSGTVFYLLKSLVDLNLALKIQTGGHSKNTAVLRHFWERSTSWQRIHAEELAVASEGQRGEPNTSQTLDLDDHDEEGGEDDMDAPDVTESEPSQDESGELNKEDAQREALQLDFEPVDGRFLSSAPLVRARVIKLLKHCENWTHRYSNIIIAIGCHHPTKQHRRFFHLRIKEGVREEVPTVHQIPVSVQDPSPSQMPFWNATVQKQVVDCVQAAGKGGSTINRLADELGNLDKRTIEHYLETFTASAPPKHLMNTKIIGDLGHYGRERRHTFWTVPNLHLHFTNPKILELADEDQRELLKLNLDDVGGFRLYEVEDFYDHERDSLTKIVDEYDTLYSEETKGGKKARARRLAALAAGGEHVPRKRGRPRKNPISDPDAPPKKRGRPRKSVPEGEGVSSPKKRGRPRKTTVSVPQLEPSNELDPSGDADHQPDAPAGIPPTPKKRGRPPKHPVPDADAAPKKLGRPKKHPLPEEEAEEEAPPKKRSRPRKSELNDAAPQDKMGEEYLTQVEPQSDAFRGVVEEAGKEIAAPEMPSTAASVAAATRNGAPTPRKRGRPRKAQPEPGAVGPIYMTTTSTELGQRYNGHIKTASHEGGGSGNKGSVRSQPAAAEPHPDDQPKEQSRPLETVPLPTKPITSTPAASSVNNAPSDPPLMMPTHHTVVVASTHSPIADSRLLDDDRLDADVDMDMSWADVDIVRHKPQTQTPRRKNGNSSKSAMPPPSSSSKDPVTQADRVSAVSLAPSIPTKRNDSSPDHSFTNQRVTTKRPNVMTSKLLSESTVSDEIEGHEFDKSSNPPGSAISGIQRADKPVPTSKKITLANMLRQSEFIEILESSGGMAYTSGPDFPAKHLALLTQLHSEGKPASGPPDTSSDRRTMRATFEALHAKGRVNKTSFNARTANGIQKPGVIYSLPGVEQRNLEEFIDSQKQGLVAFRPVKLPRLGEEIAFEKRPGTKHSKASTLLTQRHPLESTAFADITDPSEQRAWIISEPRFLLQYAGFMTGRFARARELHLMVANAMEQAIPTSPHLLSTQLFRTSYLWEDLPFGSYCAQIPFATYHESLSHYLDVDEHRWTPVREIPKSLFQELDIGTSRDKKKFRDVIDILVALDVIVPLLEVDGDMAPHHVHGDLQLTRAPPHVLPTYCFLNEQAPLYQFHQSTAPELVIMMPLTSFADRSAYWNKLKAAALDPLAPATTTNPSKVLTNIEVSRSITQARAWESEYTLSHYQKEYLLGRMDPLSGELDFSDEEQMQQHDYVTGAPRGVMRRFVEQKIRSNKGAMHRIKAKQDKARLEAERSANAAVAVSRKAQELRLRLAQDWENILKAVLPTEVGDDLKVKLTPLRLEFENSGGRLAKNFSIDKVNTKIRDVLGLSQHEKLGALPVEFINKGKKFSKLRSVKSSTAPAPASRLPVTSGGKSVYDLINDQDARPEIRKRRAKKKESGNANDEQAEPASRRKRFKWNDEYDELCIDSMVIVRVRAQDTKQKVDLESIRQVFPGLDRNGVRNRFARVSTSLAGYIHRLENAWRVLWREHRGTALLKDKNPSDLRGFDLAEHIIFLRDNTDKAALRRGEDVAGFLPPTISELIAHFDIVEQPSLEEPRYQFLSSSHTADEQRETAFGDEAFTLSNDPVFSTMEMSDELGKVKAMFKMIVSTEEKNHDIAAAEALMAGIENQTIEIAHAQLRPTFIAHADKKRPGRGFRYHEAQAQAVLGIYPKTLYQDAESFEEDLFASVDPITWPQIGSDGSVLPLLCLLSDNKVTATIDIPPIKELKVAVKDNSKKIVDENIECSLSFQLKSAAISSSFPIDSPSSAATSLPTPDVASLTTSPNSYIHGQTTSNLPAACGRTSEVTIGRVVDCAACLEESLALAVAKLTLNERANIMNTLSTVVASIEKGCTIDELMAATGLQHNELHRANNVLNSASIPLVFSLTWTNTPRIVAAAHMRHWSARIHPHATDVRKQEVAPTDAPRKQNLSVHQGKAKSSQLHGKQQLGDDNSRADTGSDAEGDAEGDDDVDGPPNDDLTMGAADVAEEEKAVMIGDEDETVNALAVLPRRWRDIHGNFMPKIWRDGLAAVLSNVVVRPGISEIELVFRLKDIFDRPEVLELLDYLRSEGFVRRVVDEALEASQYPADLVLGMTNKTESSHVYWFAVEDASWWHVHH